MSVTAKVLPEEMHYCNKGNVLVRECNIFNKMGHLGRKVTITVDT